MSKEKTLNVVIRKNCGRHAWYVPLVRVLVICYVNRAQSYITMV